VSTAIDIREISKIFPAASGVKASTAVDGVSLRVEPGELFFLLGPSGCGKTTLLRMIAGFIDPSGGSIHFEEGATRRDVTHLAPEKRNTGMVFQSYALWPHMTVEQNVAFGLTVRKVGQDERRTRVMEALSQVRMETYADRKPTQLSGGQQQRVALARALVVRPSVLLLDEPLSNLDAKLRLELRSEIRRVCKGAGITTVYVTHDQKEALSMADRIAVMRSGRVVQMGTPSQLYRAPHSRFVAEFLGETNVLKGEVLERAAGSVRLRTALGEHRIATETALSGEVCVSVRPESVRVSDSGEGVRGRIRDIVYLGDIAQYDIEIGGAHVRSAVLNPRDGGNPPTAMDGVVVSVDARDIAVIANGDTA